MVTLDATLAHVRREARQIDVARLVVLALIAVPYVLAMAARLVWRALAVVVSYTVAAVKVGWQAGAPSTSKGG
jgi:hypothetical protein